jgi:hypothetical protein
MRSRSLNSATPAIEDGGIYLRSNKYLYRAGTK